MPNGNTMGLRLCEARAKDKETWYAAHVAAFMVCGAPCHRMELGLGI